MTGHNARRCEAVSVGTLVHTTGLHELYLRSDSLLPGTPFYGRASREGYSARAPFRSITNTRRPPELAARAKSQNFRRYSCVLFGNVPHTFPPLNKRFSWKKVWSVNQKCPSRYVHSAMAFVNSMYLVSAPFLHCIMFGITFFMLTSAPLYPSPSRHCVFLLFKGLCFQVLPPYYPKPIFLSTF